MEQRQRANKGQEPGPDATETDTTDTGEIYGYQTHTQTTLRISKTAETNEQKTTNATQKTTE